MIMLFLPIQDQLELVGYVERTFDVKRSPSRGQVANDTTDDPAVAKTDGCGLQNAGSEFVALFVHLLTPVLIESRFLD